MNFKELVPILQISIAPVILISGVGLLLLSMTNRLGRAIDRARLLADAFAKAPKDQREPIAAQLGIISRRATLLRVAITLSAVSVLLAAVLIIALFLGALAGAATGIPIVVLFIACMGCLIASLITFIMDINLSLVALRTEIAAKRAG